MLLYATCDGKYDETKNYDEINKKKRLEETDACESNRIFNVYCENEDQEMCDDVNGIPDESKLNIPYIEDNLLQLKEELYAEKEKEKFTVEDNECLDDPFWFDDPTILIDGERMSEIMPSRHLSFNRNLNAMARFVIFLFLITFALSRKANTLYLTIAILILTLYIHSYDVSSLDKIKAIVDSLNGICNGTPTLQQPPNKKEEPEQKEEPEKEVEEEKEIEYFIDPVKVNYEEYEKVNPDKKRQFNPKYFKSVSELAGEAEQKRVQLHNKLQSAYLKQSPAEYFYGKNLERHMYI